MLRRLNSFLIVLAIMAIVVPVASAGGVPKVAVPTGWTYDWEAGVLIVTYPHGLEIIKESTTFDKTATEVKVEEASGEVTITAPTEMREKISLVEADFQPPITIYTTLDPTKVNVVSPPKPPTAEEVLKAALSIYDLSGDEVVMMPGVLNPIGALNVRFGPSVVYKVVVTMVAANADVFVPDEEYRSQVQQWVPGWSLVSEEPHRGWVNVCYTKQMQNSAICRQPQQPAAPPTNGTGTGAPSAPVAPAPAPAAPGACYDGELVLTHKADEGDTLSRTPVGEAERADIMEMSWAGEGFGGLDRAIVVIPRLGPVWAVNVKAGVQTIATRGFCGTNEAVASWAVAAHVPSLQQASRDAEGQQPTSEEVGVYRLDYEARALYVEKAAPAGPSPEEVLGWIELSFHEGGVRSSTPLHVVR